MAGTVDVELDDVEVLGGSDLAWHVEYEGEEYWLPKSVVPEVPEVGEVGAVVVPRWLAVQKGMV